MIEDLVDAAVGEGASARQRHVFRESLRALVRFAKADQLLEIKASVRKLTGAVTAGAGRRKTKVDALMRQGQLELNSSEPHVRPDASCMKNSQKS